MDVRLPLRVPSRQYICLVDKTITCVMSVTSGIKLAGKASYDPTTKFWLKGRAMMVLRPISHLIG